MRIPNPFSWIADRPWLARVTGYALFCLAATIVFAYLRFPSEALTTLVERYVAKAPVRVTVANAALSIFPGITLSDVTIADPRTKKDIITVKTISVRPSFLSALTGGKTALVRAEALGGTAEASIGLGGKDGNISDVTLSFAGLDPGLGAWWDQVPYAKFSGKISGGGMFTMDNNDIAKGTGRLTASISEGAVTLKKGVAPNAPGIIVDSGELELELNTLVLNVKKAELRGPQTAASVTGNIILAPDMNPKLTWLNLKAKLTLTKEFKKNLGPLAMLLPKEKEGGYAITIAGSLAQPIVRLKK